MTRLLALCATVLLVTGCDAIVGGTCRDGYRPAFGFCVPQDDPGDGGRDGGMDGANPDGDMDASDARDSSDGRRRDVEALDGDLNPDGDGATDGSDDDGGDGGDASDATGCALGETMCSDGCANTDESHEHCGMCERACGGDEVCSAGECMAACETPLTLCGAVCVDVASDENNCGVCDRSCGSGICVDNDCVASVPGHVVVIGHDFTSRRAGMNRLAANAVFLAPRRPVQAVAYHGVSSMASRTNIDFAINETGGMWSKTVVAAGDVPSALASADVFIVYPQNTATDAELLALGDAWSTALPMFVDRGGVIVVFDGPGDNDGTHQTLAGAGLFSATGIVDISADNLTVDRPADALALGVPLTYRGQLSTVRFLTADTEIVVSHDRGPVVLHHVVVPSM